MDCRRSLPEAELLAEWQALADGALAPAGLNRPELIGAAMAVHGGGEIAAVHHDGKLVMALPVAGVRRGVSILSNWTSPVNFHGLPHLDRELAVPAMTAFLRHAAVPVMLHSVPRDGALWEALQAASGHFAIVESWERASLDLAGAYEQWFEGNFERKRRKEYRRLRARLGEQGTLTAEVLAPGGDVAPWAEDFLALEAKGWKGRRGTALGQVPGAAASLTAAMTGLHRSGHLRFWRLGLDGRAVAMLYAIVDGSEAWLGKIAHDPAFDRFSPGVLMILEATGRMFADGSITRADSCAIPGHPMIGNIWRDRLGVADVMLAAPAVGKLTFRAALAAETLRRAARSRARDFYYKLTGRHRS